MIKHKLLTLLGVALSSYLMTGSALAVVSYTETFDTNASNWLAGTSTTMVPVPTTYNASGGIGDSGYISFTHSFTSASMGSFPGAPPLQLMFRGNNADNASGDAFVGNWVADGVQSLSVAVRHNYSSSLNFYARIAGTGGNGASIANIAEYAIAPDTWTTVTIPITDNNPPFLSYGSGTFSSAFTNVQNLQLGVYVPVSTTFTNFRMDLDNVTVNAVPEPASLGLVGIGTLASFVLWRKRRSRVA